MIQKIVYFLNLFGLYVIFGIWDGSFSDCVTNFFKSVCKMVVIMLSENDVIGMLSAAYQTLNARCIKPASRRGNGA